MHAFLVRHLGYTAVLRLSWVFGLVIVYLPLAVLRWVPGHSMLGNLFVEYSFFQALGLGLPLFLSVWAVMLTTCLTLDVERGRPRCWIDDPWNEKDGKRWVSIPIGHPAVFVLFTLLAAPAVAVVVATAGDFGQKVSSALGILLGGFLAYLLVDLGVYLVRCDNEEFRVLTWYPFGGLIAPVRALGKMHGLLTTITDYLGPRVGFWQDVYNPRRLPTAERATLHRRLVKDSHLFAVWCFLAVLFGYALVYWLLQPSAQLLHWDIASQPPAAFAFALILPIIFLLAPFWNALRRYRVALTVTALVAFVLYSIGGALDLGDGHTGPAHTYDVFAVDGEPPLSATDALGVPPPAEDSTLIVVTASGGGILATGWTATVLTELHRAYPRFRKEMRLISAVSGGSVAAAYYLTAHDGTTADERLSDSVLDDVVGKAMKSSLAVTAYGFAFPDFRRAVIPIAVREDFDRGRLLEEDWRTTATAGHARRFPTLLSSWTKDIRSGAKPAVIFNTTVMETGERVAITPITSLRTDWRGLSLEPGRRLAARTLSEFLDKAHSYSPDVWTAARLSATFSYVSPAARAAIASLSANGTVTRHQPVAQAAKQHLIDGGYHDNSGVASALDWLELVRAPKRIALIEIRARVNGESETPIGQWRSAWFGPLLGLLSSWGAAQSTVSDTAINRLMVRLGPSLQSFVFVMYGDGPLSWHLSREQQKDIWHAWCDRRNKATLAAFLKFVGADPVTGRCDRDPKDTPPRFVAGRRAAR